MKSLDEIEDTWTNGVSDSIVLELDMLTSYCMDEAFRDDIVVLLG